jgi:hypothetical protein
MWWWCLLIHIALNCVCKYHNNNILYDKKTTILNLKLLKKLKTTYDYGKYYNKIWYKRNVSQLTFLTLAIENNFGGKCLKAVRTVHCSIVRIVGDFILYCFHKLEITWYAWPLDMVWHVGTILWLTFISVFFDTFVIKFNLKNSLNSRFWLFPTEFLIIK